MNQLTKHDAAQTLTVHDDSGVAFANMADVIRFAEFMAVSGVAIPKHLRGNPGICMAIVTQAIEWKVSPFSLANKSYSVNDRLAYEAQLIAAVILRRAPIKGRLKYDYLGDGTNRTCTVSAELREPAGERVEYTSPPFGKIHPKNSPLWQHDPDQQLAYYSARAFCRRHFPDVLMGVYSLDEAEDQPPEPRVVGSSRPANLDDRLSQLAAPAEISLPPDADPETEEIIAQHGEAATVTVECITAGAGGGSASGEAIIRETTADPAKPPGPGNELEYIAYFEQWISANVDPHDRQLRWNTEKNLRNRCHVSPETRERLREMVLGET